MAGTRTFTDVKHGGRYVASSPISAAKKAGRQHMGTGRSIVIHLRETTAGSAHHEYKYRVKRSKMRVPKIVERDGVEIVYKYTTVAKAI